MAFTRLGVGGPSAAYPGFSAKDESVALLDVPGTATLATSTMSLTLTSLACALTVSSAVASLTIDASASEEG